MGTIIICNLLLIICAAALAFFFSPEEERGWYAYGAFVFTAGLSMLGWVIFVAQHFAVKYW